LQKVKDEYNRVLKIEPNNLEANSNMGLLFYNESVNIITQIDYVNIEAFRVVETETIALFKKALPFMQKAYDSDPNDKSTLEALAGIYHSLNEFDKSDTYKKLMGENDK